MSAGRHLFAQRYVIGWDRHGLVKIGSGNNRRVKRFTGTRGASVIDIAYYEDLSDGIRSESWLQDQVRRRWPRAWQDKAEAQFLLGRDTGGYMEFYAVPVEEWPDLRLLAAI